MFSFTPILLFAEFFELGLNAREQIPDLLERFLNRKRAETHRKTVHSATSVVGPSKNHAQIALHLFRQPHASNRFRIKSFRRQNMSAKSVVFGGLCISGKYLSRTFSNCVSRLFLSSQLLTHRWILLAEQAVIIFTV